MKKTLSLVLVLALCIGLLAGCGSGNAGKTPAADSGAAASNPKSGEQVASNALQGLAEAAEKFDFKDGDYRVAVMMPMSGPVSFFVGYFKPILDYAVTKLNAEGGVNGHKVELLYKDDQGDPSIEASALAEVLDENVCAVIGPFMDTCGPVVAQWAEANHIPVFMCCGLATDVGFENESKYVFTVGSSPWAWAKMYANMVKEKGYKSAYYIGNVGGVPDDVYYFFWQEIKNMGLDVKDAGQIRLSGDETDLTNVITSIMASGADVVFSSLAGGLAITLLQQGSQLGFFDDVPLLGVYINDSNHTESIGKDYPVDKVYSITWYPVNFPEAEDFAREVYVMSDNIIPCSASLNFYYGFQVICDAVSKLSYEDAYNGDKMVEATESVNVESVFGNIYFTKYSHQLIFPQFFANTQFCEEWGGIALPDHNDYIEYGAEVFPSETEWNTEKAARGF